MSSRKGKARGRLTVEITEEEYRRLEHLQKFLGGPSPETRRIPGKLEISISSDCEIRAPV